MNKRAKDTKIKTNESLERKSNEINSSIIGIDKVILELRVLGKIMMISNGDRIKTELEKYATTDERKIIWTLIDGKRSIEDISKMITSTANMVYRFLSKLEDAGLITQEHNMPPKRIINYTPSDWNKLRNKSSNSHRKSNTKQKVGA